MKIEMGESLFYSWLRHVKECQIVQTNWKTSSQWTLLHEEELQLVMNKVDDFFKEKYNYKIFKQLSSLSQFLQQAECDVMGFSIQDGFCNIYAVDVAFHEAGLNYGDKETTIAKIINKSLRTALCIYGYMDSSEAEIVFASPKIHNAVISDLLLCIDDLQSIMDQLGYHFKFRIIANESFKSLVLDPILIASAGISDTTELFIRSYQMLMMFDNQSFRSQTARSRKRTSSDKPEMNYEGHEDSYNELKIGKLVQKIMFPILESGVLTNDEIEELQDEAKGGYSKTKLGIDFPLLVRKDGNYDKSRYYKNPVLINDIEYLVCSQWFETHANNDRPLLIKWIEEHQN